MEPQAFPDRLAVLVRARRGALRLTQRDLAELAGVSERFVRFVEQGKRSVQLNSLLALLDTLGLELQLETRTSSAARAAAGGLSTVPPVPVPPVPVPPARAEPAGPGERRP